MSEKLPNGLRGADHVAYLTWKPRETVAFYRDVLGLELVSCITAKGWGNDPHPDFVHFFFDIGAGGKIAFFFYFGMQPTDLHAGPDLLGKVRHLALLVDTKEELDAYQERIEAAGYPLRHRVMHEMIESIYMFDPNGYNLEISRPLRPVGEVDVLDAALSIEALCDIVDEPGASLERLWERKAELILAGSEG
jgi:catechol 2,3-dioxygenase-like lactoylglutathione lyase family enzyme